MSPADQTKTFANDLHALIDRYRSEFDITYAQVIGGLAMQTHATTAEALHQTDEPE